MKAKISQFIKKHPVFMGSLLVLTGIAYIVSVGIANIMIESGSCMPMNSVPMFIWGAFMIIVTLAIIVFIMGILIWFAVDSLRNNYYDYDYDCYNYYN